MVPKSIAAMLPVATRKPDSSLGTRLATSQPLGVRSLGLAMIRCRNSLGGGGAGKGGEAGLRSTPH